MQNSGSQWYCHQPLGEYMENAQKQGGKGSSSHNTALDVTVAEHGGISEK